MNNSLFATSTFAGQFNQRPSNSENHVNKEMVKKWFAQNCMYVVTGITVILAVILIPIIMLARSQL